MDALRAQRAAINQQKKIERSRILDFVLQKSNGLIESNYFVGASVAVATAMFACIPYAAHRIANANAIIRRHLRRAMQDMPAPPPNMFFPPVPPLLDPYDPQAAAAPAA